MTYARFGALLALTTAVAGALVAAAHAWLDVGYALPFSVGTVVFFVLFCTVLFWLGKRTAGARNRMLFTNVFMGVTLVKMFFCGAIVVAYALLAAPQNRLFVVPFFTSYLVFSVFEVIFLIQLSGETHPDPPAAARPESEGA